MNRVSPLGLTVPKRRTETRTFTDPEHPGVEFSFTFGTRNFVVVSRAQSCQEELIEKWVKPHQGERVPFPIQVEEGEPPIYVDQTMCQIAATAWAMQAGPPESHYSADEMLALELTSPTVFEELVNWIGKMGTEEEAGTNGDGGLLGNASRGDTDHSSSPPSLEDTLTPSLSIISPTFSGASTSDMLVGRG